MREETLYELETPYRQKFRIKGFRFGEGEKVCAMVAAVCGNEVQQMYVCALLVKKLRKLEEQGGHCTRQRAAGGALRQPFFHERGQPVLGHGQNGHQPDVPRL